MLVKRLPLLLFIGALAGGCSSLYLAAETDPENPLDSDEVTLAAGDEGLKNPLPPVKIVMPCATSRLTTP